MLNIRLPKEAKEFIVDDIIRYFEQERGETLGSLAAEQILDFMISAVGPAVYNQAITDARALLAERMQNLDDDLYALEKRRKR